MTANRAASVERRLDVEYDNTNGRPLVIDLVKPVGRIGCPVVVWLHGGGWESGSQRVVIERGGLDFLAKSGYLVASVEYRLSTEAKFPAQLDDVSRAIAWLEKHGARLGARCDLLGIAGYSAGAHLASLAAVRFGAAQPSAGRPIRAAFVIAPPTDFAASPYVADPSSHPLNLEQTAEERLIGGPIPEHSELASAANPVAFVRPGCPPFFVIHGERDEYVHVSQSHLLFDALARARGDVTLIEVTEATHALRRVGEPPPKEAFPRRVMRWMNDFFGAYLNGSCEPPQAGKQVLTVEELWG